MSVDVSGPADPGGRARWVAPTRAVLVAGGVALLAVGGWHLADLRAAQLRSLATWLVAGLVLHDGVLVPAVTVATLAAGAVLRRLATRGVGGHRLRLPADALAWVVGGLAVGGVLTLVVLPELHARALGSANPTVLPGDYGRHLVLVWAAIVVVVAVGLTASWIRPRRGRRPPAPGASRRRRRACRARP